MSRELQESTTELVSSFGRFLKLTAETPEEEQLSAASSVFAGFGKGLEDWEQPKKLPDWARRLIAGILRVIADILDP